MREHIYILTNTANTPYTVSQLSLVTAGGLCHLDLPSSKELLFPKVGSKVLD